MTVTRPWDVLLEAVPNGAERAGEVRRKQKGTSSYLYTAVDLIWLLLGTVATEHPDVMLSGVPLTGYTLSTQEDGEGTGSKAQTESTDQPWERGQC